MIECIFTIDYEIYGNGEGSLHDLVYAPTQKLISTFRERNARFVAFVEVAELEMIERHGTDPAIRDVRAQIAEMRQSGFEIALHLHPQWYNASFLGGQWRLDYREYNLCTLSPERIDEIVSRSISHLRDLAADSTFQPCSFRAGNWLFQPSEQATRALAAHGIRLDSSVFKGGLQHANHLDYRPALKNGYYWKFRDDVNVSVPDGVLVEVPIYTRMVPSWTMATPKRLALQRKTRAAISATTANPGSSRLNTLRDRFRLQYPLKFDFCRMTLDELTATVDCVLAVDKLDPAPFRPLVAIGHSKDLLDLHTIDAFLAYLECNRIPVSTFDQVVTKCM